MVRGNLPPGAWTVEAGIALRLGLSRTPIAARSSGCTANATSSSSALGRCTTPSGTRWIAIGGSTRARSSTSSIDRSSEHDEIVAAIRKHDIPDVRRTLDQNWAGGFERIRGLIEIFGERGSW
jgi:DNA-binding GntR family transcriptional regulator